jgi:hypothetical protein
MADLNLDGALNFTGNLTLGAESAGKVKVGGLEVLVEVAPGTSQGTAPPVILPPPPSAPSDPGPGVGVINSFNKTVRVGAKAIVTQGIVMQGNVPSWPGMVLPSQGNTGPVTVNHIAMNVITDQAVVFPSGGTASFSGPSGQ